MSLSVHQRQHAFDDEQRCHSEQVADAFPVHGSLPPLHEIENAILGCASLMVIICT